MAERLVYEVLRPFQGDQEWQIGDLIADHAHWPFGRVEQLVDLRLIRPSVVTVETEAQLSERQSLSEVEQPSQIERGQTETENLEGLKMSELHTRAKAFGINSFGTKKKILIAKIREAEANGRR